MVMKVSEHSDNRVWRIIGRVDDEIIVKQSKRKSRAIKSIRNAICQRLCNSANIEYKLGWWKGLAGKPKVMFVDSFIGDILQVDENEEIDIEIHDVPNQFYLLSMVRVLLLDKIEMVPSNFDSWGYYHYGEGDDEKFYLLGKDISIPKEVSSTRTDEEEEVLAIFDAQDYFYSCPECKSDIPFGTIIVVTENYRLVPTSCCDKMFWSKADESISHYWA